MRSIKDDALRGIVAAIVDVRDPSGFQAKANLSTITVTQGVIDDCACQSIMVDQD
jgi:hypothetical protein